MCPEQYRLYYIENLRPRFPAASLVFGQILHQALAHFFQTEGDPVGFFRASWEGAKEVKLGYGQRDSWERLRDTGDLLLEKFMREELPRLEDIEAVERPFELDITGLELPFVGVIDLLGKLDGRRTVVDFKTSASRYEDHEVILADQLTAYQLAAPDAQQTAFCVLVKTKEPKIDWQIATRSVEQLTEYLAKAQLIAQEISASRFYKRPGKWCAWCDYLPVCIGDRHRAKESLVQIE